MIRQLPKNRILLRSSFLLGILPAYLALMAVGSGCSCGLGGDGYFRLSVERLYQGDNFFGYPDSPDSSVIMPANEKTTVLTFIPGMDFTLPAGDFNLSGTVTDLLARGGVFPSQVKFDVVHVADGSRAGSTFSTKLKIKNGKITQKGSKFEGFEMKGGDRLRYLARPKKNPVLRSHLYHINYNLEVPNGLVSVLRMAAGMVRDGWTFNPESLGSAGLPEGAVPMPLVVRLDPPSGPEVRAKKQNLLTLEFGIPFELKKGQVFVSGTYAPAAVRSAAGIPSSIKFFITHLNAAGNKVASQKFTGQLNGTTIPATTIDLSGFELQAGDRLKVQMKPKGGTIADGDQVNLVLAWFQV